MGCLHTKPKLKPQTIVVHSCDYHSNGVARILKPRAATPDRYASSSATIDIVSGDVTTAGHPKFVRKLKPRTTSPRSPPASPHITLPSTPEADRNTIQVLDAEDLEPAEYCPLTEAEVETATGQFEEQSVVTASRVKLKASPGSAGSSQVNSSKQSTLSSQDTLTVEELDTEMDDFNRLSKIHLSSHPKIVTNPRDKGMGETLTEKNTLLPLRKQKQEEEQAILKQQIIDNTNKHTEMHKVTKLKSQKVQKKRKQKHKHKIERVNETEKETANNHDEIVKIVDLNVHSTENGQIHKPEPASKSKSCEEFQSSNKEDEIVTLVSKQAKNEANNQKKNDEISRTRDSDDVKETNKQADSNKLNNLNKNTSDEISRARGSGDVKETNKHTDSNKLNNLNNNTSVVCEPVETTEGISVAYRSGTKDTNNVLQDMNVSGSSESNLRASVETRVLSPLPKELYQKELEKVRMNRKRKRFPRRNPDDTPRVPKPNDTEAMGYLGSNVIFRDKQKSSRGSTPMPFDLSSTESLRGNDSIFSENSDMTLLDKSNEFVADSVVFRDNTVERDIDIFSLDSVEEANNRFFSDKKNDLIRGDLPFQSDLQSGSSTSDVYTKQKLLYSRFERRPYSETALRLAGRPPLPPEDAKTVARPVSEKVRRAQAYSRYFTPDVDLY